MPPAAEFSTLLLPPHQRIARWTEAAFDRFVESSFEVLDEAGFIASMQHCDLAALSLTRIASAGHGRKRVTRSQRQVARAAEDFMLVSVQLEGECSVIQGGREARLTPGQFAIYDTRQPYELILPQDYQQAVLRVPRATLLSRLGGDDDLTARAVPADLLPARMLARMVRCACEYPAPHSTSEPREAAASQHTAPLSTAQSLDLADALLGVLASGLRSVQGTADAAALASARHVARAKVHVAAHLADPQLTVSHVAAALGLSLSALHKAFRGEGTTLERWIWESRLLACRRALHDPRWAGRTLTDIAFSFGFSDAAHFSRSFRRRFGSSPRAWREAGPLHLTDPMHASGATPAQA